MTFSPILEYWVPGMVIEPALITALDHRGAEAVDGKGGGVYNTTQDLTLNGITARTLANGLGVEIDGPLTFAGNLNAPANLSVTGTSTLTGAVSAGSTLTVAGAATLSSNVTVGGTLTLTTGAVTGNVTASGNVTGDGLAVSDVANTVALAARDVTRSIAETPNYAAEWSPTETGGMETTGTSGKKMFIPLPVPHQSTLKKVTALVQGAGGHGALPSLGGDALSIAVVRQSVGLPFARTVVASTDDPTATIAGYQAPHVVTLDGLSEDIDRTLYRYYIQIKAEQGISAVAGLNWYGSTFTVEADRLDEAT